MAVRTSGGCGPLDVLLRRLAAVCIVNTCVDRGVDSLGIPIDALNGSGILGAQRDAGKGVG
jgi:hypothetical protein